MMRGFTLIEALVYMALLSFLLVGMYTTNLAITTAAFRIQTEAQILSEGIFISELIKNAVSRSPAIMYAGTDSLRVSEDSTFRRVGDVLWYDYQSSSQQLTYPPILLREFTSAFVSSTTIPIYVEVRFTLSAHGIERSFNSVFYP